MFDKRRTVLVFIYLMECPLRGFLGLFAASVVMAQQPSAVSKSAAVCRDMATRPGECFEAIQRLSIHGGLDRALPESRKLSEANPENKAYRREYAKLLYWKGRLPQAWRVAQHLAQADPADRELYAKISIAYHGKVLKSLRRSPRKYLRYLRRIPVGEQESYDIKIMTVDAWVQRGRLVKALHEAKTLWHRYPESTEAKALVATLYFWNKHYTRSLKLLRQLYRQTGEATYQKQIHDVEVARIDARLKRDNTAILAALEQRHFAQAKARYQRIIDAGLAPRFDQQYPATPCKVTMQHMAGAGVEMYRSDDPARDRVAYVEGTFPIADWIVYARAEQIDRYGARDHKLSAELYPILPEGYWGYLSLAKTFDPDFSVQHAVGAHLYKETGTWQYNASLDYSRYPDTQAVTVGAGYAYYITSEWVWKQRMTYSVMNGTYSLSSGFQYHTPCHLDFEVGYTYSTDKEPIPHTTRTSAFTTHALTLSGEYPITSHLHMVGKARYIRNNHPDYHTDRKGVSLGLRTYW